MRYAGGAVGAPTDLECKEIEYYGTDSEVGVYRLNRDRGLDYSEIGDAAEIGPYKVTGKGGRNT